jgi:hypothetical protein
MKHIHSDSGIATTSGVIAGSANIQASSLLAAHAEQRLAGDQRVTYRCQCCGQAVPFDALSAQCLCTNECYEADH